MIDNQIKIFLKNSKNLLTNKCYCDIIHTVKRNKETTNAFDTDITDKVI